MHFLPSCIPSVKFLADTYLKYIGWMLYDKVGEVRMACLNVLEPLYSDPDTAPHLELFTEKFKVSHFYIVSVCTLKLLSVHQDSLCDGLSNGLITLQYFHFW